MLVLPSMLGYNEKHKLRQSQQVSQVLVSQEGTEKFPED